MRTNSEYARLAYRKAILGEAISLVRRRYMPDDVGTAQATLLCEDVMKGDEQVPVEEFGHFLTELEIQAAEADLEMRKFEFRRRPEPPKPKEPPVAENPVKKENSPPDGTGKSTKPKPKPQAN